MAPIRGAKRVLAHGVSERTNQGATMLSQRNSTVIDNRDAEQQMYQYLEARIDVLKRRLAELEAENQTLRRNIAPASNQSTPRHAA
jgi:hypothetical protein